MKMFTTINFAKMRELGLSLEEYVLLDIVSFFDNGYYASKKTLADHLGISERKIFRMINALIKKGFLKKDGSNLKVMNFTPAKMAENPAKMAVEPCQNGSSTMTNCHTKKENKKDNKKNTKKDKFEQLLSEIKKKAPNLTEAQINLIKDFYEYRKQIKKPIHTVKPIVSYLKQLKKISDEGYDIYEAIELMKEGEWQTIKLEYCKNALEKEVKYVW